jgi:hypothetical protein
MPEDGKAKQEMVMVRVRRRRKLVILMNRGSHLANFLKATYTPSAATIPIPPGAFTRKTLRRFETTAGHDTIGEPRVT